MAISVYIQIQIGFDRKKTKKKIARIMRSVVKRLREWSLLGERVWDWTKNSIQVMGVKKAVGRGYYGGGGGSVKLAKYQIFRGENKRL